MGGLAGCKLHKCATLGVILLFIFSIFSILTTLGVILLFVFNIFSISNYIKVIMMIRAIFIYDVDTAEAQKAK